MGKSNKKAKSERITALRKQYDAFLEEDQKRKKRNEYILGKLDKMRSTTALVPVRSKVDNHLSEVRDVVYHPDSSSTHNYRSSVTTRNSIFPGIESNNSESYLIQEISKKYILIPKSQSLFIDNALQPLLLKQNPDSLLPVENIPIKDDPCKASPDENIDWKSKYDILNLLENEQKESVKFDTTVESDLQVNKESSLNNPHQKPTNDYSNIINTDGQQSPSTKFLDEMSEKDLPNNILEYASKKIENNGKEIICQNKKTDKKGYDSSEEAVTTSDPKAIDYKLEQLKLDYTNADETNATLTCSPIAESSNYKSKPDINVNLSSIEADIPQIEQVDETYTENANKEIGYSIENDSAMYAQHVSEEQDLKDSAQTFMSENQISPTPAIVATDMRQDTSYPDDETITYGNELDQVGVQNVDDTMYEQNKNNETVVIDDRNTVDVSGAIDDFNTEQAEMFYTECPEVNTVYPPDPEHPQQLEFNYYEGNEAEEYSTELNDQMDVTEKYDPSYEQQYDNANRELEHQQFEEKHLYQEQQHSDQQIYEQYEQQPVLQEHKGYNQPQAELDLQQYEQQYVTQQEVEQVLDTEDGYSQKQQKLGIEAQYDNKSPVL